MATELRLNLVRAAILSTVLLSSRVHGALSDDSNIFKKIAKVSFLHHRRALEFAVLRYLREIENSPSLVHLIVESAQDGAEKTRETIVRTCSNFGKSVTIRLSDESAPNHRAPVHRRYPKLQNVLAVSRGVARLRPERLKEAYKKAWNSAAFFGIFVEEEAIDDDRAEALLKSFWDIDSSNVVLVGLNSSQSAFPKIYSYDPFSNVGNGANGSLYQVNSKEPLFPDKMNNLRGRAIAVSLYPHKPSASLPKNGDFASATGMDVELLRYVSTRLNFTVDLLTKDVEASSYVTRLPNGRKVGPIGDVLTKKTEYLGNSQFLESVDIEKASLDFVYPYWRSQSIVVVRRASPLPAFFYVIRGVETIYVLCVALLTIFVFFVYHRFVKRADNFLMTILGLVLFQHLGKIGERNSDRIISLALLYGSFVTVTICQGYLVNDLTAPPIFPNIDTLRALAGDRSIRLMVRPFELRILEREFANENKQKLSRISRVEYNFSYCMDRLKRSRHIGCTIDESYGKFSLSDYRRNQLNAARNERDSGKVEPPSLHIVKESLIDFWQSYLVKRGFPYLAKFDETIGRAVEFGFVEKWLRDDRGKRFTEPPESKEPPTLGLLHLDYTFAVLVIGDALATVVLAVEFLVAGDWPRDSSMKFLRRVGTTTTRWLNLLLDRN